ncbi:rRNA maturation RNase YbeY [Candidatus Parcubacteria bacterium]|nr:rRNA maturation RNase YbeY [Candidatus Parcubacteria bacterium]
MIEINNKTKSRIDLNLVKKIADNFLKTHKNRNCEVSIAFVGDRVIRKLNRNYRKIDKVTDVLSFPGEGIFLGEVIIDYAQIKRQAREFGSSVNDELVFILVHGLLHLLGYDDKTEKGAKEMERLGEKFILNFYDKN